MLDGVPTPTEEEMKEAKENTKKSIKQLIQMIPEVSDYTIEINIED